MELLTGMDVASVVERFGPLPPERVVALLRQVCRSLAEAHGAGVLHRDIKPHNLFLCRLRLEFDVLKVLDFGLVKTLDDSTVQVTAEGVLTGTPAYMPPQRVLGGTADERSDLYSLGCVAYWMLTGRTVFSGDPMAVMIHHAGTVPAPPSKILAHALPAGLDEIVLACLDKAPQNRPSSAVELWSRLGDVALPTPWSPERAELWWGEHLPEFARPSRSDGPHRRNQASTRTMTRSTGRQCRAGDPRGGPPAMPNAINTSHLRTNGARPRPVYMNSAGVYDASASRLCRRRESPRRARPGETTMKSVPSRPGRCRVMMMPTLAVADDTTLVQAFIPFEFTVGTTYAACRHLQDLSPVRRAGPARRRQQGAPSAAVRQPG